MEGEEEFDLHKFDDEDDMTEITDIAAMLLSASPTILALLVALAAVSLCGFALFLVYRTLHRGRE